MGSPSTTVTQRFQCPLLQMVILNAPLTDQWLPKWHMCSQWVTSENKGCRERPLVAMSLSRSQIQFPVVGLCLGVWVGEKGKVNKTWPCKLYINVWFVSSCKNRVGYIRKSVWRLEYKQQMQQIQVNFFRALNTRQWKDSFLVTGRWTILSHKLYTHPTWPRGDQELMVMIVMDYRHHGRVYALTTKPMSPTFWPCGQVAHLALWSPGVESLYSPATCDVRSGMASVRPSGDVLHPYDPYEGPPG